MVILSRWVFGILGSGALVALIFLLVVSGVEPFAQNTMQTTSVLNLFGLLGSHFVDTQVAIDTQDSLSFISPAMPRYSAPISPVDLDNDESFGANTIFIEENPVVFSEFSAPVENVTSTIQVALMVPIVSSTITITSSTEVVVSSTLPVVVVSPSVESSIITPETRVFSASVVTPVDIKIEPTLCVGTSSTPSHIVRINELAWMGTTGSYTDEWIELYNTSSSSFSLAGAQLIASSSKSFFSVRFGDNDFMSPNGYFLLERTNDTSVPNIVADKIYTGALNDDEEVVELFDAGCDGLDRVDFKKDFPIVSTNMDRRSIELKPDGTFALYEGDADVASGIFGSPRRENSYPRVEIASSTTEIVASSTEIVSVPTSTAEIVPQDVSVSSTIGVMINEILFDGEGSDKGKEFVELYNPSDTDQDLKGWSLRLLKTGATSTASLATFGDNSDDRTTILSHGFLLVGLNSYDAANFNGVPADVRRSNALPNGSTSLTTGGDDEVSIVLFDTNKNEVDRVTYTAQSINKEGQSLQRNELGIFVVSDTPSPQASRL